MTSAITVTGRSWRNGDAVLEGVDDVTQKMEIAFRTIELGQSTGTVTLRARLLNNSSGTLRAPMWIQDSEHQVSRAQR
jgi:hypothetical protein